MGVNKYVLYPFNHKWLTVTGIMLAAVVLIIHKNWILSIGTSDVFKGWTLIWNYFNCVVLNASGHCTVAQ